MTSQKPFSSWMSITQVAKDLGTTPLNVLMHIKRGLLEGAEIDGAWHINPQSLADLLQRRSEGTVPALCKSACSKAGGCGSCP